MAYPVYIREKARKLRTERKLSLDEIAERLALPKTTIFYWIRDLPDPEIKYRDSPARARARAKGARLNVERHKALREAAYRRGLEEYAQLCLEPTFVDFICMYIGEGYKRNRNTVSLCNSNPKVVRLADHWIRRFSKNPVKYGLQYHADQDPHYLVLFWSFGLDVNPQLISFQRKSNSGQLSGRSWRSKYGVLTVRVHDTDLRARLQAWMDLTQEAWLDSVLLGV
jgi:AcrR family transcriptional regulator